jgi:hypothetical protein
MALAFLLGLAVWRWLPRLERRATDPARLRTLKWAIVAVAVLILMLEVVVRPFLWDVREVVSFENRPASVIGSSGDELLLYAARAGERRQYRIRTDAPGLQRNLGSRAIFQE